MANTKQAKKRMRQDEVRRVHNRSIKSALRTEIKKLRKMIESGDKDAATKQIQIVESKADKAAKRNVVHTKTANRVKGRLKTAIASL